MSYEVIYNFFVARYNEFVDNYNFPVAKYNKYVGIYNFSVDNYNFCVATITFLWQMLGYLVFYNFFVAKFESNTPTLLLITL
jgi:hypothetical protein